MLVCFGGEELNQNLFGVALRWSLAAPIITCIPLWFMVCSNRSFFTPRFSYDQVIPHGATDQRLHFLLVWYFNVKTICREALFVPLCRLTTHWKNCRLPTLIRFSVSLLPEIFRHFHRVNSNPGSTTKPSVTCSSCSYSIIDLWPLIRATVRRLRNSLMQ